MAGFTHFDAEGKARAASPPAGVLERARVGQAWRERWDSFRTVTPRRMNGLPGASLAGDPEGLSTAPEIVDAPAPAVET